MNLSSLNLLKRHIGNQSLFRAAVPESWAGRIRVTHPCAGRHQTKQALFMLPLDLHVLSLSLAFILSQDQTLHCTFFLFIRLSLNSSFIVVKIFSSFKLSRFFLRSTIEVNFIVLAYRKN